MYLIPIFLEAAVSLSDAERVAALKHISMTPQEPIYNWGNPIDLFNEEKPEAGAWKRKYEEPQQEQSKRQKTTGIQSLSTAGDVTPAQDLDVSVDL